MNEEEKKSIEEFRKQLRLAINIDDVTTAIRNDNAQTILNLIEKLQKENEELKEYIAIAPNLDEMTASKYRNIQQNAYIQGRAEEQQKAEQIIYENYIPIQKVKDKIEELDYKDIGNFERRCKQEVLQSLLEKE